MSLSKEEILFYLNSEDQTTINELYAKADRIREEVVGNKVYLRAIIEFSNYCRKNCNYCGLRRGNQRLKRYRMSLKEIVEEVKKAAKLGYKTVVLQSGEDPYYTGDKIARLIEEIKNTTNLTITLSIGERSKAEYALWKKYGVKRYLLRHETANSKLYQSLHPDGDFNARLQALHWLKELGYEVGAGSMVGLPGQKKEDLLLDINLIRELEVDMVGIGPFIPHPETPLGESRGGSLQQTFILLALTRLAVPSVNLPATTALGTLDFEGREKALQLGANVIMPNATPRKYRALYQLYPNKICLEDNPDACRFCIESKIKALGRGTDLEMGCS